MNDKRAFLSALAGTLCILSLLLLAIVLNNQAPVPEDTANSIPIATTNHIVRPGVYRLTGELIDKPLVIDTIRDKVKLILDNVTIKNSNGPAIICRSTDSLAIKLVGKNILQDGNEYSPDYIDMKGAIHSETDLAFDGDGSLSIITKHDAIHVNEAVHILSGNFDISAGDDAIHAKNSLLIDGGVIKIAKSYEGLESANITINNGTISIVSSDDGINVNSGEFVSINGGDVHVNASGDGIDSNGYIYINGGVVSIDGPTKDSNGALDSEFGVIIKGGTVVALGASGMAKAPASTSSQYSASIFFDSTLPAGSKIEIRNTDQEVTLQYVALKTFDHAVVSTADFKSGESYTLYINDAEYTRFNILDTTTVVKML